MRPVIKTQDTLRELEEDSAASAIDFVSEAASVAASAAPSQHPGGGRKG